jgi:hypothetical protein
MRSRWEASGSETWNFFGIRRRKAASMLWSWREAGRQCGKGRKRWSRQRHTRLACLSPRGRGFGCSRRSSSRPRACGGCSARQLRQGGRHLASNRRGNGREELCLDCRRHLVTIARAIPQERIDLVDKDLGDECERRQISWMCAGDHAMSQAKTHDCRLELLCQRKEAGDELVRFAVPLARQARQRYVDLQQG